jgi:DNA repair protein RecO (recombination protein O)
MLSIVLKRQDVRESDQFITLFTDEFGKREVLARGIKKITSKLSAYLMPFFILETECVPAKETDLLITAQPYQTFRTIPQDFEKMSVVSYCLALVDNLTVLKHPEPR